MYGHGRQYNKQYKVSDTFPITYGEVFMVRNGDGQVVEQWTDKGKDKHSRKWAVHIHEIRSFWH